jgi:hypothetical protein
MYIKLRDTRQRRCVDLPINASYERIGCQEAHRPREQAIHRTGEETVAEK